MAIFSSRTKDARQWLSQYYHAVLIILLKEVILQYSHNNLDHSMDSSRKHSNKYNKVNQQKKFHLLSLIYKQKTPIRQAAQAVGINYLTAKTIVFFHKNHYKSYQFDLKNPAHPSQTAQKMPTASFAPIRKTNPLNQKLIKPKTRVEVVCSIGNVLSLCTQPSNCPQGEITGQFGSKNQQALNVYQNGLVPKVEDKGFDWSQLDATFQGIPLQIIRFISGSGDRGKGRETNNLRIGQQ